MCSQVVIGLGARRAKDAQCKPAEERAKQRRCFEPFECNASLPTKTLQVVESIKHIDYLSKPTENRHGFEGSAFAFGVIISIDLGDLDLGSILENLWSVESMLVQPFRSFAFVIQQTGRSSFRSFRPLDAHIQVQVYMDMPRCTPCSSFRFGYTKMYQMH